MSPTTATPRYRFLRPDDPEVIAHVVPVDGVFPVLPPNFQPVENEDPLDDGVPPTRVGVAVREAWSKATGRSAQECPTGVIRAIELIAVPTDANVKSVREVKKVRNASGNFFAIDLDVYVPLVRAATINPRMAQAAQRYMRSEYDRTIVHEISDGLAIELIDAKHPHQISEAQRKGRNPSDYRTLEQKTFADSLALEGVREPLRGFVFHLEAARNGGAHIVETNDGWTRVNVAKAILDSLVGLPADLSTLHLEAGAGAYRLRDVTAEDISTAWQHLRFAGSREPVWPGERGEADSAHISAWLGIASQSQLAVLRLMTAPMTIGLCVEPYEGYRDHDVVYADMARFHQREQKPVEWSSPDATVFRARNVVSALLRHRLISDDEAAVFLGDTDVPFQDDPEGVPFRNKLVAAVSTMICGVVDDPDCSNRYRTSLDTIKRFGAPKSALQAATTAAALAGTVAGLEGSAQVGQFTAAIARSFRKESISKIGRHKGNWTHVIDRGLEAIHQDAETEYQLVQGTEDARAAELGPNQRALAILALVAHAANPALIDYVDPATSQPQPSSLTINGRGGKGDVSTNDPETFVFNAARSLSGISELVEIVRSFIEDENPRVPISPVEQSDMTEIWFRKRWAHKPTVDGEPVYRGRSEDESGADDNERDKVETAALAADPSSWTDAVVRRIDELSLIASEMHELAEVKASFDLARVDEADWDAEDESLPTMISLHGLEPSHVSLIKKDIDELGKFADDGLLGYIERMSQ